MASTEIYKGIGTKNPNVALLITFQKWSLRFKSCGLFEFY